MLVLIVDDHFFYRQGLRACIDMSFPAAKFLEASDGHHAKKLFDENPNIDLCILDIRVPGIDGIGLTSLMRKARPNLPIVVNSGSEGHNSIQLAIDAGAWAYISKSEPLDQFISTVGQALKGNIILPADVARQINTVGQSIRQQITQRQVEILRLCAHGNSNRDIAQKVNLSEATIKSHLASAMDVLGKRDRTACVAEAMRRGLFTLD